MVLTILRLLADNPFTRIAIQIGAAAMGLLLIIGVIVRRDRKIQRINDVEKDHARADRLRDRGRDAAARGVRPSDIIYRD